MNLVWVEWNKKLCAIAPMKPYLNPRVIAPTGAIPNPPKPIGFRMGFYLMYNLNNNSIISN
jgi:hypothetical protein